MLGFAVNDTSLDQVVSWAGAQRGRSKTAVIAVINANKLWLARRDPKLAEFLHTAELVLPEWAAAWGVWITCGRKISPVYGIEFTKTFVATAATAGLRPFFLGGTPETADRLQAALAERYPQLHPAGFHHGFFSKTEERGLIERINASSTDILFVGMGSPRQELWLAANQARLTVPVAIGVGGSFDVIAGVKEDTPPWIRGTGMEWLYRLALDPRRYFRRYLVINPWFLLEILRARLRGG